MAFLGRKDLREIVDTQRCIMPFCENNLKNAAYELSLGAEVYSTDSKTGKVEILENPKNRGVEINPGQFALLLTKEVVRVPNAYIAFISIKAGEKLKGLINVSGFHVDPGFVGHLLFSVYNAGPSTIVLNSGEPYFPIWYAQLTVELDEEEAYGKSNEHYNKLDHIPAKYIEFLKRKDLASPNVLLERIRNNESILNNLKWVAGIVITLGITLMGVGITFYLKSFSDPSKFNEGYYAGIKEKRAKELVDSSFSTIKIDRVIAIKIDSILKEKNIK